MPKFSSESFKYRYGPLKDRFLFRCTELFRCRQSELLQLLYVIVIWVRWTVPVSHNVSISSEPYNYLIQLLWKVVSSNLMLSIKWASELVKAWNRFTLNDPFNCEFCPNLLLRHLFTKVHFWKTSIRCSHSWIERFSACHYNTITTAVCQVESLRYLNNRNKNRPAQLMRRAVSIQILLSDNFAIIGEDAVCHFAILGNYNTVKTFAEMECRFADRSNAVR